MARAIFAKITIAKVYQMRNSKALDLPMAAASALVPGTHAHFVA